MPSNTSGQLVIGAQVRVAHPVDASDRRLVGSVGKLVRFTTPHGFAVVEFAGRVAYLHPDSLEVVA